MKTQSENISSKQFLTGNGHSSSVSASFQVEDALNLVRLSKILEHIFSRNVSKGPAFSRPTQSQTLKYGLDDAIRIKKKDLVLIEYSFTPSDRNFQTIWMPKEILTKFSARKSWSLGTILILSMLQFLGHFRFKPDLLNVPYSLGQCKCVLLS